MNFIKSVKPDNLLFFQIYKHKGISINRSARECRSLTPPKLLHSKPIYCAPGEQIDERILEELSKINQSVNSNHLSYINRLRNLFQLGPQKEKKGKEYQLFFAGFFLGEGSLNVSAKKNQSSRFGIMLDPEFSVTQHVNGISHLVYALELFGTGRIRHKSGSNATFVFRIDNRKSLLEKCIPFCEKFCTPYANEAWKGRFLLFKELLDLFLAGEQMKEEGFIYKMLPLWDQLRRQYQRTSSFQSLSEAQRYAKDQLRKR